MTCPRYNQMRAEMFLSIQRKSNVELTTDFLLFGTDAVSEEVNTFIFKAVQKYIKLNSLSVSLGKNNTIIMTLFDRFPGYLGGW